MVRLFSILTAVFFLHTSFSSFAEEPTMPFNEVKTGMKGTGYTVLKGDRIEPFDVEILGVIRN